MTRDDTTLIRTSGNVFADLGFAEPEASVQKMRSEFMIAMDKMTDDTLADGSGHQSQR